MTTPSSETIAWSRGFFRIWVLLAVVWIIGAVWVALNPPAQSGPPQFDETLPFLKLAPDGRVFGSLAECQTVAKLDARIDLQNCTEYFEAERWQPVRLFARSAAKVVERISESGSAAISKNPHGETHSTRQSIARRLAVVVR
jgi:hypothetical protein